jgi:hypothetical protein
VAAAAAAAATEHNLSHQSVSIHGKGTKLCCIENEQEPKQVFSPLITTDQQQVDSMTPSETSLNSND